MRVVEQLKIAKPSTLAASAEVGLPYQLALKATGGKAPYQWAAAGLPAGLTLDAATGAISGTPTIPSSSPVKVTLTDALGLTTVMDLNLVVQPKLALQKTALPIAKAGSIYSTLLSKSGGARPYKWAVTGLKKLPAGVQLNARTGRLYGVPLRAGTYRFRVQVTDALGGRSSLSYVLKVTRGAARR
jgi:hypothetical protein